MFGYDDAIPSCYRRNRGDADFSGGGKCMPDGFRTFDPASGLPPMRSSRCATLVKYWNAIRGDRRLPSRDDIDPGAIKSVLPHVMMTGIEHDPFRVFYRLVGTEIVRFAKFDFTGCYADALHFQDTEGADWAEYYRAVVAARQPGIGLSHWTVAGELQRWIEFVICPLSSDGTKIDRCIAVEDYEHLNMVELDTLRPVLPQ
jgi:hypothetical protein